MSSHFTNLTLCNTIVEILKLLINSQHNFLFLSEFNSFTDIKKII
jgi:hypothetical protein